MKEKINLLETVLQMRLKHIRNWGDVVFVHDEQNGLLNITWKSFLGDPDNNAFFHQTIYPEKMIDKVIREQKNKLKRDIPTIEKEILKSIL
jgi:uncharacterized membrane protein YcaP (DUF421 family)